MGMFFEGLLDYRGFLGPDLFKIMPFCPSEFIFVNFSDDESDGI